VRDKLNRVVRVAENTTAVPAPAAGHFHLALARISRPVNNTTITPSMLVDLRKQILPLLDLTQLVRVLTSYGYGFTGINTGLI